MMSSITASLRQITLLTFTCLLCVTAHGQTKIAFKSRAESEFHRLQAAYHTDPKNDTNAWQFARTCFDLCEFATNNSQKAAIAKQGIAACQSLIARVPKSAPGHYYLAMNDGELADAEAPSLAAYKLVHEIEREFKQAVALDESFDFAGADRSLGLLYRDAPGWPLSIGNKFKARDYLYRAAATASNYPDNQLTLAESHLQWRQEDDAEKALRNLDTIWSGAQTNLTGVAWEKSWYDWTKRRAAAQAEFQKLFHRVPGT